MIKNEGYDWLIPFCWLRSFWRWIGGCTAGWLWELLFWGGTTWPEMQTDSASDDLLDRTSVCWVCAFASSLGYQYSGPATNLCPQKRQGFQHHDHGIMESLDLICRPRWKHDSGWEATNSWRLADWHRPGGLHGSFQHQGHGMPWPWPAMATAAHHQGPGQVSSIENYVTVTLRLTTQHAAQTWEHGFSNGGSIE